MEAWAFTKPSLPSRERFRAADLCNRGGDGLTPGERVSYTRRFIGYGMMMPGRPRKWVLAVTSWAWQTRAVA